MKDKLELYRILVVEDNKLAQMGAEMALEEALDNWKDIKFSIDFAENSSQATEKASKKHYHFIFMDIGLPDKDGFHTTRVIREMEITKQLKRTPIVALTGHDTKEHRDKAKQIGMDEFTEKPLTAEVAFSLFQKYVVKQ